MNCVEKNEVAKGLGPDTGKTPNYQDPVDLVLPSYQA